MSAQSNPFELQPGQPAMPASQSLKLVETPPGARRIAVLLVALLLSVTLGLIFIPWQQSVTGTGRVTVFSPMERPQNIEAQIPGRLVAWHVIEGQLVKEGELVAELSDLDAKFLDLQQPQRLKAQKAALEARRTAAQARAAALEKQISALGGSRAAALPTAREKALQAGDRLRAAEQALQAAEQNLKTAQLNAERIRELDQRGLRSRRDRELAELDLVRGQTEVERSRAALEVAKRDTTVGSLDQMKVDNDTQASLNSAQATLASVHETIATVTSDLLKLEVEIQNLEQRTEQRRVTAPRAGRIVRLLTVGAGETVKAGDVLAVLAPTTTDQAVELLLSDNDAPLVSVGRHVRLQFAGWPALQFTGWPSVAVGTFGGKVAVIDSVDDGTSRYRVIIVPDQETIAAKLDEPWPSNQFLRPGAEVSGWVMLDTVSLGFELWRQFNAFPPTVSREGAYPTGKTKSGVGKSTSKDEK